MAVSLDVLNPSPAAPPVAARPSSYPTTRTCTGTRAPNWPVPCSAGSPARRRERC
jgi:hypothetical protein